ncbi:MAG: phosphatidylinositol kinase [Acidimicrobiaceae bacterium]|nr:phosphatidylinositol kinase [Acidimicrobiaceae bacterium]
MSPDELADPISFLTHAEVEIEGRMPWSSNATFLTTLRCDGAGGADGAGGVVEQQAIYKPVRGERPLWDFEPGLHRRERAMFLLSEQLGLDLVPPTVIRDGPLGEGSFQWFVPADHSEHYFTIYEQREHLHDRLREMAVLDVIANNTDRKSGHCLLQPGPDDDATLDRVWAIDNGLCFSVPYKVRTVIWEFAGDTIDDALLERIAPLIEVVPAPIADLLDDDEVVALQHRATKLVTERVLPSEDGNYHNYPWPLV